MMEWTLLKATPTIAKATGLVVGWELRLQVAIDGASAFDDVKLGVPPEKPISAWTVADLISLIAQTCTTDRAIRRADAQANRELPHLSLKRSPLALLERLEKLCAIVKFRAAYDVIESCTLEQLGGDAHVRIYSSQLQIE